MSRARGRGARPSRPPPARGTAPPLRRDRAAAAVLAIALLANLPVLGVGFVLDDHPVVERDPRVLEARLGEIFTTSYWNSPTESAEYRPLVLTTYAVEHALLGAAPWHFHLVNLLLHAIVSLAVLIAGRALGLPQRAAALAAGLFAAHPIHLDVLAPVVGRAELLAGIGYLMPLALYVRLRRGGRIAPGLLAGLAACVALGAFSKENALAVVPLLVLVELLLLRGAPPRRTLAAGAATVFGVVGIYLGARAAVLGGLLPEAGSGAILPLENPLVGEPLGVRLLTAVSILGTYLRLFAWPVGLSPDYAFDTLPVVRNALAPVVWLTAGGVTGLLVLALRRLPARPQAALAAAAFLGPYAIVSNAPFLIGTMLAERLLYQPSVGLCWLVGLGIDAAARRAPALEHPSRLAAVLALPALALAAANLERAADWQDEAGLYREAAEVHPRNFLLQRNLGTLALEAGRYPEALHYMTVVTQLAPDYAKGWSDRGFLHLATGDPVAAVAALERAVELDPDAPTPLRNLAAGYRQLNRYKDAARAEARARRLAAEPGS